MLTPDDEDATYRLDVKLEHLLHVGGYLGQQHVGPVVTTHVSDDNGPHGAGREDRLPWRGTLEIMYTFQWNPGNHVHLSVEPWKSGTPFSGTGNHVHLSVEPWKSHTPFSGTLEIMYTFQWNPGNHVHLLVELEITYTF